MQVARRRHDASRPDGLADRDAVLRGVAGAVLCAVALGILWAVTVPAYWPVDELSHAAYAHALVEGRLPTIHTAIDPTGMPGMAERLAFERAAGHHGRQDVWTSNHPPLYFLLAGVPLHVGAALGAPGLGFLAARGLSVLAAAVAVALTAASARVLVPEHPRIAVAAAAFAALTPSVSHFSGLVFNDAMSFAVCTLVLVCALMALRDGSPAWVLAVAAAGTAAALTRVAALPLIALAVVACAAGAWHTAAAHGRLRSALRAGGIAAAAPALGAGWFYWRNWQRYGDPTGTGALLDKFDRDPNGELREILLDVGFHASQWDRLLGDLATGGIWTQGWRMVVVRGLGLAILAGLAVAALRWGRRWAFPRATSRDVRASQPRGRRRRGGHPAPGWADGRWRRWAWPIVLAFPASLLVATARFHAEGGWAHARYLLSAMAVLALVCAFGLQALGEHERAGPTVVGLGALALVGTGAWVEFLERGEAVWREDGRIFLLLRIGESWHEPVVALALMGLAGGLLLVTRSLLDLSVHHPLDTMR